VTALRVLAEVLQAEHLDLEGFWLVYELEVEMVQRVVYKL
jgi:hypothetical protein